jgi:hypothetical protein
MYAVLVIEYKWTFGKLVSVSFFYFTETLPAGIGIGHSIIIVSLSVVLLILVVDKRQDRHIDEIIQTQHKMPRPLIPLTTTALEKQVTIFTSYLLCEIKMPVTIVSSQSLQDLVSLCSIFCVF